MVVYKYRNWPCNIQTQDDLWNVSGYDTKEDSGGILERKR